MDNTALTATLARIEQRQQTYQVVARRILDTLELHIEKLDAILEAATRTLARARSPKPCKPSWPRCTSRRPCCECYPRAVSIRQTPSCWSSLRVRTSIVLNQTRHFISTSRTWDRDDAAGSIEEIAADAMSVLDPAALWPAHPMDDQVPDGLGCVYFGAAGVAWALDHLHRIGAPVDAHDLSPVLATALVRNAPWFAATGYPGNASLLMGELGIRLVAMRVAPELGLADKIYVLAAANTDLPTVELMWGLPGSMLACVHMDAMTGDARFKALFQVQASRLLGELETTESGPIWTQHLYGLTRRWLGPVHGFAGNMLPLLHGWDWLTSDQRRGGRRRATNPCVACGPLRVGGGLAGRRAE